MTAPEVAKNRPESNIEPMNEALDRLINDKLYLFGHGTAEKESAEGTLADGLQSRHTDLFSTADGLLTLADDPNAFAENEAALKDWPHLGAKYVVVIGVERLDPEQTPHRRYLQSIVQPKIEGEDKAYEATSIIDRRFIAGYFDATAGTFVNNPDFDPHYDASLLETTVNEDIRRELDPQEHPLARMGGTALSHTGSVEQGGTSTSTQSNSPDDWVW